MNIRHQFTLLRRAYRSALRPSAAIGDVRQGAAIIAARVNACSALRAFTGRWDTCDISRERCGVGYWPRERKHRCNPPHVSASCKRWMMEDRGIAPLGLMRLA